MDRKSILISNISVDKMRGRWASAAIGAGIARSRAHAEMVQQAQAYEAQRQQAQQRQIEALQHQQKQRSGHQQTSGQEDVTTKLQS